MINKKEDLAGIVEVEFTMFVRPKGQPRQSTGRKFGTGKLSAYLPKDHPIHGYKNLAKQLFMEKYHGDPWNVPLAVVIECGFSRSKKMRRGGPHERDWFTQKPDFDNLAKAVTDALEGLLYDNDSYICHATQTKYFCADYEEEHLRFYAYQLAPYEELEYEQQCNE